MGASYPLADLMAALKMGECYWWWARHLWEHDDMHDFSLHVVWLYDGHFRSSFVGAYRFKFGGICMEGLGGSWGKGKSIP